MVAAVADKPPRPSEDEPSLVPSYMRHDPGGALPDRQAFEEMRTLGRTSRRPGAILRWLAGVGLVLLVLGGIGWALSNRSSATPLGVDTVEVVPSPAVVRAATPTAGVISVSGVVPMASIPPPPGRQQRDTFTVTPGPPPGIVLAAPRTTETPAATATRAAQIAPAAVAGATPNAGLVRPNGPVIHARPIEGGGVTGVEDLRRRMVAAGVEPALIESPVYGAANWGGLSDVSGKVWMGWDATFLYLLVKVVDDVFVQESSGILLYQGDSVEVQLDGDLAGDFTSRVYNDDDWQFGLSPGNLLTANPQWQWWSYRGAPGPGTIQMAAVRDSDGYSLAAAIPWSMVKVTPAAGNTYGLAVNLNDNDTPGTLEQKSIVSTSPVRQLNDPTSWGTLQLDGPRP